MRRFRVLALASVLLGGLCACHTISGIGQDVKSAGGAIEKAGSH
jgi:predicted small secreted protein